MITGHIGIALAVRAVRRDVPLAPLLVASVLPDIADGALWAANICSPMGLYSHSLPAIGGLTAAAFVVAFIVARGSGIAGVRSAGIAGVVALVVLLHLPADLVTGFKLMWPNGPVLGLVLYDHPLRDFLLEVPILVAGWWLLRRTSSAQPAPRWATAGLTLGLLIASQAAMDASKVFGNPGKPNACVAGERARP